MSVAAIKSKEKKGKQKALPKLKAILANPSKTRCPVLDEAELVHLKYLLRNAFEESKLEPKAFATKSGICLGLESSLRSISNQTSSCVFISLSIKPNYIVSLIARNAESKNETQPVFAQPKLENFIQEIFSVQALCMVFTKDLLANNEKLNSWVVERRKAEKVRNIHLSTDKNLKKHKKKAKKTVELHGSTTKSSEVIKESEVKSEKSITPWTGDFISFENNSEPKSILDGNEAVEALTEIIDKLPTSSKSIIKNEENVAHMDIDNITHLPNVKKESDNSDSDDFLDEYKALTVHKIKAISNLLEWQWRQLAEIFHTNLEPFVGSCTTTLLKVMTLSNVWFTIL